MTLNNRHQPVLLQEILNLLDCAPGECVVDATVGYGGHSFEICKRLGEKGTLIGIDRDEEAVECAWTVLHTFPCRVEILHGNFARIDELVWGLEIEQVDKILYDTGVSSPQLDQPERGFSFVDAPLDMRMSQSDSETAADLLAYISEQDLARVLREYADERRSRSIARAIVSRRLGSPIRTTGELRALVHRCYGGMSHQHGIDTATRTFLAIRIALNRELENLKVSLEKAWKLLRPGGRLVTISFHSGEHRIVKEFIQRRLGRCICPPGMPKCGCGARIEAELLVHGTITARPLETANNPRSRSAQMRGIRRIEQ
ncbi:MAG TPA: 16S rRNA (cytosine(1402)-N(4))-methyltransferase RsmH [bacterium]|nr:16S rRNA (cytosine(1402)-N(4))-methyltransferase RsmH [bacterium]HPO07413.1 16S rRNA (cytosine(1402)-N(4))-methyltransferase RsmH [bacterium]HQO35319.1 16S rRNA (cytosine(1402)-N(4))-methyltransferase RsmH [bacterium]HQP98628.1 16S rRNA (cytosine(1402)-N(4))-methyltransferase RsmH [bacterium]